MTLDPTVLLKQKKYVTFAIYTLPSIGTCLHKKSEWIHQRLCGFGHSSFPPLSFVYSRVRNKHSPTLIIFFTFFQGLRPYSGLHRAYLSSISVRYKWGFAYSFSKIFQGLCLFKGHVNSLLFRIQTVRQDRVNGPVFVNIIKRKPIRISHYDHESKKVNHLKLSSYVKKGSLSTVSWYT